MLQQEQNGLSTQFTDLLDAYDVLTTRKSDAEGDIDTLKEVNLFQEDKIAHLEDKLKNSEVKIQDAKISTELGWRKKTEELDGEIVRYQKEISC